MASRRDEVIMERDFLLLPKRKGRYKVTLSHRGIYFSPVSNNNSTYEESLLKISDIIGCHSLNKSDIQSTQVSTTDDCDKINDVEFSFVEPPNFMRQIRNALNPFSCGFVIFAYPFVKKKLSSKQIRQRQIFAFEIPSTSNSSEEFQERRSEAYTWHNVINCLTRELPLNLQDLSKNIPPERKPWLFLINPFSGPGKAHTIFKQDIIPILYEASIPYKAIVTTHAGHASELVKTTNLSEWYGIIIVSGDGLIFETINGIMQRDDWATSLKTPIGCLPGGSGNALCCSINYAAGEPVDSSMVLHSAFVLVKHRVIPMDLVAVHLPDRTCFSFLSITWGIMADIDYETEKYRNLGETRFTVGAVVGILGLRTYRGKVSFLPVAEYVPLAGNSTKVLSKVRRLSLRSRSSSKATLSSLEDDRIKTSAKLLSHRSYSMDENSYKDCQPNAEDSITSFHDVTNGSSKTSSLSNTDSLVGDQDTSRVLATDRNMNDNSEKRIQGNFSTAGRAGEANHLQDDHNNDNAYVLHPSMNGLSQQNEDQPIVENGESFASEQEPAFDFDQSNSFSEERTLAGSSTNQQAGPLPVRQNVTDGISQQIEKSSSHITVLNTGSPVGDGLPETGRDEFEIEEETYLGRKADFSPVPTPLLPALEEPVPEGWASVDGDFVLVMAVYQTHLGSDMLAAPDARLQDGLINLMMVRKGVSKANMFRLFLSFSQGNHVSSPHVEVVKVLAFRLEPHSSNGNIMVDGERFEPAPIQAQILPGLARVMAIK